MAAGRVVSRRSSGSESGRPFATRERELNVFRTASVRVRTARVKQRPTSRRRPLEQLSRPASGHNARGCKCRASDRSSTSALARQSRLRPLDLRTCPTTPPTRERTVRHVLLTASFIHPAVRRRSAPPAQPAHRRVGARLAAPHRSGRGRARSRSRPAGRPAGLRPRPATSAPATSARAASETPTYTGTFVFDNDFAALRPGGTPARAEHERPARRARRSRASAA